jgi:transcriptional regulator with XRE-family HTH domain
MRLGEFLNQKKITIRDFAKVVGVSLDTVRGILYERGYVSATLAKKIYAYTDGAVSIEDLILNRAGWERCPCCSHTISDASKAIDAEVLDLAREYKLQLDAERKKAG